MSGLTQALDAVVKRNADLFALEVEGIEIVFCLPSVKKAAQYKMLLSLADDSTTNIIHEHIFRESVIDSYMANKDDSLPAGIPETISKLVLFLSGQNDNSEEYTDLLFKTYRAQQDSNDMYMKRVICQCFSGYTFESLEELNYQKLVNIFIQAEKVLMDRGIIEKVHEFSSPEDAKPKPFRVEDVIRNDQAAQAEFDSPEDPEAMAQAAQFRAEAIKRAHAEEEKHRAMVRRQRQGR